MWVRSLSFIFITLWSSAFISSKFIVSEATPFAALGLRFVLVAFGYAAYARYCGERFFVSWHENAKAMLIGTLFHGFYLGGVFYAISQGMSAGLAALIVTLQPVLTAVLARPLLGEAVSARQWLGIVLGFTGAAIVLGVDLRDDLNAAAYAAIIVALLAITAGTLWQKRVSNNLPLSVNNMYQAVSAALFHCFAAYCFEEAMINFTAQFIWAMSWQIFIVSFGAFTILTYLIKHGSASKTATLFFLVPGVSVIMAWLVADEMLSPAGIIGLLISSFGVYIATRQNKGKGAEK